MNAEGIFYIGYKCWMRCFQISCYAGIWFKYFLRDEINFRIWCSRNFIEKAILYLVKFMSRAPFYRAEKCDFVLPIWKWSVKSALDAVQNVRYILM